MSNSKAEEPGKKKRSREGLGDGADKVASDERPKKKPSKKKKAKSAPQPSESEPEPLVTQEPTCVREEIGDPDPQIDPSTYVVQEGTKSSDVTRGLPTQRSLLRVNRSEGSLGKRSWLEFSDCVNFSYKGATPLIYDPDRCAELTQQIRGGPLKMPPVEDLVFKK